MSGHEPARGSKLDDPGGATPPAGEDAIRRLHEAGRAAWPAVTLSRDALSSHLAARAGTGQPLDERYAADVYLAAACAGRVRGAVEAFEVAHMSQLGRGLARMRPSAAFLDEVKQVLREKLFVAEGGAAPKIAEYTGAGPLRSWLRVIALRAAIDLRRKQSAMVEQVEPVTDDLPPRSGSTEPELRYLKERYRRDFNEAVQAGIAALSDEQRTLMRLHFIERLTLDALASKLGAHRATVARKIATARLSVLEGARRILQERLGVDQRDLDSLIRLMQSQLDMTLPGLLRSESEGTFERRPARRNRGRSDLR